MKIEIQPDGLWYHGSNKIFFEFLTKRPLKVKMIFEL